MNLASKMHSSSEDHQLIKPTSFSWSCNLTTYSGFSKIRPTASFKRSVSKSLRPIPIPIFSAFAMFNGWSEKNGTPMMGTPALMVSIKLCTPPCVMKSLQCRCSVGWNVKRKNEEAGTMFLSTYYKKFCRHKQNVPTHRHRELFYHM